MFSDGSIKNTSVLGLGGYHFSNDIAVGLRTPFDEAERIKKKFGVASARVLGSDDHISVPSVGGRRPRDISRKVLCEIIEPRVEEILSLARQELVRAELIDKIPSALVLTGGASALSGIADMIGNVSEWVADYYDADYYAASEGEENPQGPDSGSERVIKGSAFTVPADFPAQRISKRNFATPGTSLRIYGVRCARDR